MKILIAVPTFENICPEVFKAIYDLDTTGHDVDFEFVKGYDCAKARNTIATKARDGGYDYVLMCDSDTIMPKETLQWFLEKPVDIVAGFCPHKNTKEGFSEVYKAGQYDFVKRYTYAELEGITETRLPIRGCGFACVLVKVSLFKELKFPWFKYVQYDDFRELSEDFYFCDKAGNYVIEADTRVKCGHLARYFQYK